MRLRIIFHDIYGIGGNNNAIIKEFIDKLENILYWIQIYSVQDSNTTNSTNMTNNFSKLFNDLGYSIGGVVHEQNGYAIVSI